MEKNESKNKNDIDDEVVAVITAAIASMETRPGYKLVVRSMRRTAQYSPIWNISGRLDTMRGNLNS
jgi:DNA-binding GntR family transcriptional regulator